MQKTVTSGADLSAVVCEDFANPAIEPYLRRYVPGWDGFPYDERIKIPQIAVGRRRHEFAGRHELYERNYSGGWEDIRAQVLTGAQRGGGLGEMEALVDQCLADYDTNGWTGSDWVNP